MFQTTKELALSEIQHVSKWHALAEAIRKGCKLRPAQCFWALYDGPASACALGAAFAAGHNNTDAGPDLNDAPCPVDTCILPSGRRYTIQHLNDDHRWTREAIADWLDGGVTNVSAK